MLAASVVIPCRGHAGVLARCVASVTAQAATNFEVIVVDAGRDDGVVTIANEFPAVRVVRSNEPLHAGEARNLGVRYARGAALLFIDADCVAEPGWITAALAELKKARLVGGAVDDGAPWHPIAAIDNLLQFAEVPPKRLAGPVGVLPGCNMAIARADFEQLGGFPSTALPAEDCLFVSRAAARWPRGALSFQPAMRIRHFGRTTLPALAVHQYRFGYSRAMLGLALKPFHRRLGQYAVVAPAVALTRLIHLTRCSARWRSLALLKMLIFSPVLIFAMASWCRGFRAGCRHWAASGDNT
jgi:glycosyltransferase involved in cell wall biosynthesis